MDWEECMNRAMDYIESNLCDRIDYTVAARFVNCSEWEFRRIFSIFTQIPLSEYIRRRRLSAAVTDIRNGDKIIDVAQHYGYESQSAFSRAFSQLHGIAPSLARNKEITLKPYPRLTFRLAIMEGVEMDRDSKRWTNIIGPGETGYAVSIDMDRDSIHETNSLFWGTMGSDVIGTTALPSYGGLISEDNRHLFGDVSGKKILEIGCGRGRSLQYMADRGASELWGIDLSDEQLEETRLYLASRGVQAHLICSPMEEECGLPTDYFDYIYSVYGIGWTTDLEGTFRRIASYLKKDGVFIFSWSHPIHKCVATENDTLVFKKCYYDESWYSVSLKGGVFSLTDRTMSTYINALAETGFLIERMIEQPDDDILQAKNDTLALKIKMLPGVFVIKAKKL
ncbi:MAG: methyltransferase domain-containing protein [Oscillospiraceae bacterium]|jgi:AraC-like DNA-binding protein/SAM-dependent methyltransferase|nr:methyltransferase domain-containing protein [Oscillospiraceae bacterium]